MIILDSNIISEFMRDEPDPAVVTWLDEQPRASVWTTSINVYEIRAGLHAMPAGKRRTSRVLTFEYILKETIQGRIAAFDLEAALQAAELVRISHRLLKFVAPISRSAVLGASRPAETSPSLAFRRVAPSVRNAG